LNLKEKLPNRVVNRIIFKNTFVIKRKLKHKVVIIEDNIPLSDAFEEIINNSENYIVANTFSNCEDAVKNIKNDSPKIILMDIDLPGMNGVEGTKIIKKKLPNALIIMVTVFENSEMVFNALCAGACGYLTKNFKPNELIEALEEAIAGGAPMSIHIAKMVVSSFQKQNSQITLSQREKEVLTLLAEGNSYDVLGDKLCISRNTIKFHLKNIYLKLQVHSNIEAIQKASRENLI
jgi:DNA-binding NarL/FixJ family response regulator